MLILNNSTAGIWISHKVRGVEIELKLRPFTAEIGDSIRKKHRRVEYVRDPQSRQMVKNEVIDDEAVFEDMLDFMIEDFKGIGYSESEPLAVTKENKKKIALLPASQGEQPLSDFIIEKAKEFAVIQADEIAAEIKN